MGRYFVEFDENAETIKSNKEEIEEIQPKIIKQKQNKKIKIERSREYKQIRLGIIFSSIVFPLLTALIIYVQIEKSKDFNINDKSTGKTVARYDADMQFDTIRIRQYDKKSRNVVFDAIKEKFPTIPDSFRESVVNAEEGNFEFGKIRIWSYDKDKIHIKWR